MMNQLRKIARTICFCLPALTAFHANVHGADIVRVQLASGRTFEGFVDERTTDDRLWLRFEGDATLLYRPISWARVERIEYQGRDVTVGQLQSLVPQIRTKGNLTKPLPTERPLQPQPAVESDAEAAQRMLADRSRVRSLEIDATIANWDADSDMDGIRVFVYPLDGAGQVVPVRGSVEVKLVGIRPASLPARYSYPRGNPYPKLGHWTRPISHTSVGPNGAVIDLPFTSSKTVEARDLGAYGTVVARLTVAGAGVFEARTDLVRIRLYQPIAVQ